MRRWRVEATTSPRVCPRARRRAEYTAAATYAASTLPRISQSLLVAGTSSLTTNLRAAGGKNEEEEEEFSKEELIIVDVGLIDDDDDEDDGDDDDVNGVDVAGGGGDGDVEDAGDIEVEALRLPPLDVVIGTAAIILLLVLVLVLVFALVLIVALVLVGGGSLRTLSARERTVAEGMPRAAETSLRSAEPPTSSRWRYVTIAWRSL